MNKVARNICLFLNKEHRKKPISATVVMASYLEVRSLLLRVVIAPQRVIRWAKEVYIAVDFDALNHNSDEFHFCDRR